MRKTLIIAGVAALVAVAPVAADVFTVTMKSGATFQSRYQPNQSDTDENKILLLTGFGNWISLPKDAVASVASDTEARGFGTVLDSQTIALGWAPQSSTPDDGMAEADLDPTTRLINYLREQNAPQPRPVFSNELVVEPRDGGGIPVWMNNTNTPPVGSTGPN